MRPICKTRVVFCMEQPAGEPVDRRSLDSRRRAIERGIKIALRAQGIEVEGFYVAEKASDIPSLFFMRSEGDSLNVLYVGYVIFFSSRMMDEAVEISQTLFPSVQCILFSTGVRPSQNPVVCYRGEVAFFPSTLSGEIGQFGVRSYGEPVFITDLNSTE